MLTIERIEVDAHLRVRVGDQWRVREGEQEGRIYRVIGCRTGASFKVDLAAEDVFKTVRCFGKSQALQQRRECELLEKIKEKASGECEGAMRHVEVPELTCGFLLGDPVSFFSTSPPHLGLWLATHRQLTIKESFVLGYQLFSALTLLRECQIIHGNLNLETIVMQEDEEGGWIAKIADFRWGHEWPQERTVMVDSSYYKEENLSFLWWSPEVLLKKGITDRTDVWSAAAIFCWSLVGKPLWTAREVVGQLQVIRKSLNSTDQTVLQPFKKGPTSQFCGEIRRVVTERHPVCTEIEALYLEEGFFPFLTSIFQWEAERRPTAEEVRQFFSSVEWL